MVRLTSYLSCIVATAKTAEGVTVVGWEGILRRDETLATVAELMLDAPGHMVASAEEVGRTGRALAMRADERLQAGGFYLLFPADRAGSRVPNNQMAALDGAGWKRRRDGRKSRGPAPCGRVFPEDDKVKEGKRRGGDPGSLFSTEGKDGGGFTCGRRAGIGRPWKPVLETIPESKQVERSFGRSHLIKRLTRLMDVPLVGAQ